VSRYPQRPPQRPRMSHAGTHRREERELRQGAPDSCRGVYQQQECPTNGPLLPALPSNPLGIIAGRAATRPSGQKQAYRASERPRFESEVRAWEIEKRNGRGQIRGPNGQMRVPIKRQSTARKTLSRSLQTFVVNHSPIASTLTVQSARGNQLGLEILDAHKSMV